MTRRTTRRSFLESAACAAAGIAASPRPRAARRKTGFHDKLDLGVIGVGGRGAANLNAVRTENIVALADVDERHLAAAAKRFPRARTYTDFRDLLEHRGLDAVVISTPDHCHGPAAAHALSAGLDVYCEKPLAHSVAEARSLGRLARDNGRVTQLGTQIHALDNYRRVVELVQSGAVGAVRKVHVFCRKSWGGHGRPPETPPVPSYLHWNLWLGPAPARPYNPAYHPVQWRRFWDFGEGTLGDMGCHYIDLAHWALDLRHPDRVAAEGPPPDPETAPAWLIVHYDHPPRGKRPACSLTWYDGGKRPERILADLGLAQWANGVLFLGEKGWLISDYSRHVLGPADKFQDFRPPEPWIPASIGHHREWIEACKTRGPTTCNFDYSGALTEAVLLGIVAYRSGTKLAWNADALQVRNSQAAQRLVHVGHRPGWTLGADH